MPSVTASRVLVASCWRYAGAERSPSALECSRRFCPYLSSASALDSLKATSPAMDWTGAFGHRSFRFSSRLALAS